MFLYFFISIGDTALHLAVRQRDERAIRLLIDANANICILNKNNKSPLDLAENDKNIKNLIIEQKKVVHAKISFLKFFLFFFFSNLNLY